MESTSYVLSFRMMFFLPYDHGLDFLHQLIKYFGEIKDDFVFKNELFFNDPEYVYSPRSARPSASYTY